VAAVNECNARRENKIDCMMEEQAKFLLAGHCLKKFANNENKQTQETHELFENLKKATP
jgi:hypothetical protein